MGRRSSTGHIFRWFQYLVFFRPRFGPCWTAGFLTVPVRPWRSHPLPKMGPSNPCRSTNIRLMALCAWAGKILMEPILGNGRHRQKIRRETPQTHVQQAETNLHNNTHVVAEFVLQFFVCCMAVLCRERGLAQEKRRTCTGIAQEIRNKCTATLWVLQCSFASAGPRLAGRPTHVFSL